ncbi:MAG: hypothetical protein IKA75_10685 [Bacteroidaceae bacterium]|nr:hypothetical protein [Bacteroidaceae bacterium]
MNLFISTNSDIIPFTSDFVVFMTISYGKDNGDLFFLTLLSNLYIGW